MKPFHVFNCCRKYIKILQLYISTTINVYCESYVRRCVLNLFFVHPYILLELYWLVWQYSNIKLDWRQLKSSDNFSYIWESHCIYKNDEKALPSFLWTSEDSFERWVCRAVCECFSFYVCSVTEDLIVVRTFLAFL